MRIRLVLLGLYFSFASFGAVLLENGDYCAKASECRSGACFDGYCGTSCVKDSDCSTVAKKSQAIGMCLKISNGKLASQGRCLGWSTELKQTDTTQEKAQNYCQQMSEKKGQKWRLPRKEELAYLCSEALDFKDKFTYGRCPHFKRLVDFLPNSGWFWSQSPAPNDKGSFWRIFLKSGSQQGFMTTSQKDESIFARAMCVRDI